MTLPINAASWVCLCGRILQETVDCKRCKVCGAIFCSEECLENHTKIRYGLAGIKNQSSVNQVENNAVNK